MNNDTQYTQSKEKRHRNKGFVDIPLHQLNEWFGKSAMLQVRRKQLEELGFFVDNDSIPNVSAPRAVSAPVVEQKEDEGKNIEWSTF